MIAELNMEPSKKSTPKSIEDQIEEFLRQLPPPQRPVPPEDPQEAGLTQDDKKEGEDDDKDRLTSRYPIYSGGDFDYGDDFGDDI